jgi:hypothetical protein
VPYGAHHSSPSSPHPLLPPLLACPREAARRRPSAPAGGCANRWRWGTAPAVPPAPHPPTESGRAWGPRSGGTSRVCLGLQRAAAPRDFPRYGRPPRAMAKSPDIAGTCKKIRREGEMNGRRGFRRTALDAMATKFGTSCCFSEGRQAGPRGTGSPTQPCS